MKDITHGIMLGGAIGDALGAPYEFRPRGTFADWMETVGRHQTVRDEMVGATGVWRPGEATDDTQMAVALAQSLVANQGINKTDLWNRWRAWRASAKDVGILTSVALSHESWRGASASAHDHLGRSAGNGALMRSFPLAIYAYYHPGYDFLEAVVQQAELTHADMAAADGAIIHTLAMQQVLAGSDDPIRVIDDLVRNGVVTGWEELLAPDFDPETSEYPSNGTVWGCLAQAVWAVRHSTNFEDAVTRAVNLGDDADTVGCVAGSLAGARYGANDIPQRWLDKVFVQMDTPDGNILWMAEEMEELVAALSV
jgi:ADP-ribosylglycohydrolase